MSAPAASAEDDGRGDVWFGRYRAVELLSRSPLAEVWAAHDLESRAEVVLKILDPIRQADPLAAARFSRELEILERLEIDGVARSLGLASDGERSALVLERVPGESLARRLLRGPLAVDEARGLFLALTEIVRACHARGVIHRDLKPSNVMCTPDRGPVILDFGVAHLSSAMALTRTGSVIGTPRYLAPEAIRAGEVDPRVDVFALGAMLFEALAGEPLRRADTMAELVKELDLPPRSLAALRPSLPSALVGVVERAVAPEPAERFVSVAELADALRAGRVPGRIAVAASSRCDRCGAPAVVGLPLCPGCGRPAEWVLEPGPCAVELLAAPEPARVAARLERWAGTGRTAGWARLAAPPVVVAAGVTERTARALVAEIEAAGGTAELARSRSFLGPALRSRALRPRDLLALALAHVATVTALGAALAALGAPPGASLALPPLALVGLLAALRRYKLRPLLRRGAARVAELARLPGLAERLSRLKTDRATALAALAVRRAAPLFVGEVVPPDPEVRAAVVLRLHEALEHVEAVDAHRGFLDRRPRAQLQAERARAEARGDAARVAELEAELGRLADAALAHDLAAREALDRVAEIGRLLDDSESSGAREENLLHRGRPLDEGSSALLRDGDTAG